MIRSEAREAPRRGRPPTIATERLLAIARDVFLERGIRATTSEVAKRASISEGAIFHRFATKDALFRAAMDFDPEVAPVFLTGLAARAGEDDLRKILLDLGLRLLEMGSIALPVMMMAWSNSASEYSIEKLAARSEPKSRKVLDPLRALFAAEKKLGRLKKSADPDTLARVFVGSLHHLCMHETLFKGDRDQPTHQRYVRRVVDLLLDGAGVSKRGSKGPR